MTIKTHTAIRTPGKGIQCRFCGIQIPTPPTINDMLRSVFDGDKIAVIDTATIPPSSYRPGQRDTNEQCQ